MPVYEYKCKECGFKVAKVRPVEERDVPLKCAVCKADIPRMMSMPGYMPVPGGARQSWN